MQFQHISAIFSFFFALILVASFFLNVPTVIYAIESEDRERSLEKKPIKHIIVIMQGRRSFDHYFGTYPGANGLSNETKIPLNPFDHNNTKYVYPFRFEKISYFDPDPDSKAYKTSYNNGSMNGFVHAQNIEGRDGRNVMGYYNHRNIPYYWELASNYVLADRFFSPTMKTGLPNYLHLIAGHSAGYPNKIPEQGIEINTIFDELEKKHIPWKVYIQGYNPLLNFTNEAARHDPRLLFNPLLAIPRFVHNQTLNSHIVDLEQYFYDLKNNNSLPNVSYIFGPGLNERAPKHLAEGQEFAVSLAVALMKSKYWEESAFIITYDESGGWYDHVPPPQPIEYEYGFRVPTLIISPYAKQGYIDNTLYDVTSILKLIEYLFGLAPLTERDNTANNMLNAFDFTKLPSKPFIPSGTYLKNQSGENTENKKTSVEGVQLIYGVIIALIPATAIFFRLLKKGEKNMHQT